MSYLDKIVNHKLGSILLSIILGLGLAAMFRKACKGRDCIVHYGPPNHQAEKNVYLWENKCYRFKAVPTSCKGKKELVKQEIAP